MVGWLVGAPIDRSATANNGGTLSAVPPNFGVSSRTFIYFSLDNAMALVWMTNVMNSRLRETWFSRAFGMQTLGSLDGLVGFSLDNAMALVWMTNEYIYIVV